MPKPIKIDSSYPTTEGIARDALSLRIISPAYAASASEMTAILQYIYHSYFFDKEGRTDIADTLEGIAVTEMVHLKLLGGTILALGAQPVYTAYPPACFNFYSTKYVSYSCGLKNMLEDDLAGEKHAVRAYECMLSKLKNKQVKEIIARILEDEKLHVTVLEGILQTFD